MFLKSDPTIDCSTQEFENSVSVAYCSDFYITLLPTAALVILWTQYNTLKRSADQANNESTYSQYSSPEVIVVLRFLFQNYSISTGCWEFAEMARKVILASDIILIGGKSRA